MAALMHRNWEEDHRLLQKSAARMQQAKEAASLLQTESRAAWTAAVPRRQKGPP